MTVAVHRIEVRSREAAWDAEGAAAREAVAATGPDARPERIESARVYLVEAELDAEAVRRLAEELFADPVTQEAVVGAAPPRGDVLLEVHPRPGVMDPDAEPIELAVKALVGADCRVQTGRRYDVHGLAADVARDAVERSLANVVVHQVHDAPWHPDAFLTGTKTSAPIVEVPLTGLDDAELEALSRRAHLFLDLDEMKAIQAEYRRLGREPREIELETLAQTWSEHCVHKTLKATIRFEGALPPTPDGRPRPGHEDAGGGATLVRNLLKQSVAAATHRLIDEGIDWCLSVFVDNAGIVAFDEDHAVCFKVETHNHPSAIEPYGGAATGIGGCIRDVIGTGLAAKPIAATDVFCVGEPEGWSREPDADKALPAGCLHPRRILRQVVAGVRDYGNRMGIPTLNGAVWFDDDYVGNPLVYCGCVGVMPRDRVEGAPADGDRIIALGGRTGRDGIHGATFSSAELTDTHADEFSHAVQIGNAVTEKKLLDVILAARAGGEGGRCLFRAITDCGAGGFSSAVGEMGETLGAEVDLEQAPLKYDGLTPTEVWISEAQERMVLAVPPHDVEALAALCRTHDVEWCDLGRFGAGEDPSAPELILRHAGVEVGRLPMHFLHDGLPGTHREAAWTPVPAPVTSGADGGEGTGGAGDVEPALLELLAHPNVASKHWVVRQYDHEVQGGAAVNPLVGPKGEGPGDAAVIQPVDGSSRGLAIGNGLATGLKDDPYRMALAAIDECVRNVTCVGGDPERLAILDNFCWPSCKDPRNLGALVLAAEGCHDGAVAYRTPFISGKDSLNNQFATDDGRTIEIPYTLLISGFAPVEDVARCVTMDLDAPGRLLLVVGETGPGLRGSHLERIGRSGGDAGAGVFPDVDLVAGPRRARAIHRVARAGLARSLHDASEGGLLVAAAEMAIASGHGLELDLALLPRTGSPTPLADAFAETPSRYLMEVRRDDLDAVDRLLDGEPYAVVGEVTGDGRLRAAGMGLDVTVEALRDAWRGTLDWS